MVSAHDGGSPGDGPSEGSGSEPGSSLLDALLVYAEPLVEAAHAVVLGDAELALAERLLELGARAVHVYDPDPARAARALRVDRRITVRALDGDLDVRDGVFDLALVPDVALLRDPSSALGRLRRAVSASGAVVAMGRAGMDASADGAVHFSDVLGPPSLGYAELYDLFALQFENVTMTGVLPFRGVVFAELGGGEDASPAVSVDTRLAPPNAPSVFVVLASRESVALEPYAIVQVEGDSPTEPELEPALGEGELEEKARLESELEATRARLAVSESRAVDDEAALERTAAERDAAARRASELEAVLTGAQQTIGQLERRLLAAEQGMLERDDRIAVVYAELDKLQSERALAPAPDPALLAELVTRAERAEAAVALNVADLAHVADAHANETALLEGQLRERAKVIAALEKELLRREHLVRELVASLEEAREGITPGVAFEAAAPLPTRSAEDRRRDEERAHEVTRLRSKLDELAGEVARREGELVARGWRIVELENERARLLAESPPVVPAVPITNGDTNDVVALEKELARVRDELDALRQAFMKEHDARLAAESGEELVRARAELARQAALLEQMRAR